MAARLGYVSWVAGLLAQLVLGCSGSSDTPSPLGSGGSSMAAAGGGGATGGTGAPGTGSGGASGTGGSATGGAAGSGQGGEGASGAGGAMQPPDGSQVDAAAQGGGGQRDGNDASAGAGGKPDAAGSGGSAGTSSDASTASDAGLAKCPFTSAEYFLWSGVAPGSSGATVVEKFTERSTDPQVQDRSVTGVSKPSLFPYLVTNKPNAAAMILMPGGGYTHIAWDKEGVDIAKWLNTLGISAFVLKYRLPSDYPGSPWIPLADAQRAIRTVRNFATACSIDSALIGAFGSSAGGHLASQLLTRFDAKTSNASDAIDAVSAHPGFGLLLYPVISMDASIAHAGSKTALLGANPSAADVKLYSSEQQVTSSTPPTFIAVSSKDTTVKPENSTRFDDALKAAGIAQELHVYQDGGHGVGIRDAPGDMANWPKQAATWLMTYAAPK